MSVTVWRRVGRAQPSGVGHHARQRRRAHRPFDPSTTPFDSAQDKLRGGLAQDGQSGGGVDREVDLLYHKHDDD
jgi:hypothetical protein